MLSCAVNSLPMEKRVGTFNNGLRKADFNTASLPSAGSQGFELRRVKKVGSRGHFGRAQLKTKNGFSSSRAQVVSNSTSVVTCLNRRQVKTKQSRENEYGIKPK